MEEKILQIAQKLFLTYGFKTVTMDDIATDLSISKKTIYNFFPNKNKLVEVVANNFHSQITEGITKVKESSKNPIDEIFEIKKQVMNHLKDQRGNSIYQLERFYPEIFEKLKKKGLAFMIKSLGETLSNGIEFGLIRKNIDVDFVSRIYYNSILGLMDPEIYPPKNYSLDKTMFDYREYFLRSVVTEKGLKKLDEILINDK